MQKELMFQNVHYNRVIYTRKTLLQIIKIYIHTHI